MKNFKYTESKQFKEDGKTYTIKVQIRLDDECGNGHSDFSMTGEITQGRHWVCGGCIHEEILKHWPEFKIFAELHLCDSYGAPMHAAANGFYHVKEGKKDLLMSSFRINEEQADQLMKAEAENHFKYLVEELGILEEWQEQADKGRGMLEGLKCQVVQITDERQNWQPMTEVERAAEVARVESGYYSPEAAAARAEVVRANVVKHMEAEARREYEKTEKEAAEKRDLKLYLISLGVMSDNYIYYPSTKTLKFNWMEWSAHITPEQQQMVKDHITEWDGLPTIDNYEDENKHNKT